MFKSILATLNPITQLNSLLIYFFGADTELSLTIVDWKLNHIAELGFMTLLV